MAKKTPKYFWETNDFAIVLSGELRHGQQVLDSANAIIRDVENERAVLVTSTIVLSEILTSRHPAGYQRFLDWIRLPNVELRDVDVAVAMKAADIREHILASPNQGPICTVCGRSTDCRRWADIIFTATAMLYGNQLDAIHSVDPHFQRMLQRSGSNLVAVPPSHPSVTGLNGTLFEGQSLDSP